MKLNKIIAGVLAFAITIVFLPKINFENYVKAYISSDDFNLHTYMADNILCDGTIANRRLGFYLNDAKPMAEIWLDSVTPTFKSAVSAWENVNLALGPDDIPSKAIEAKGYYMTVILSMIQASYEGDHVVDKLVNADIKEASTLYNGFAKLFKEMSNSDIDSYLSKGSFTDDEVALLNAVQKKFLEDNKFLSAGKTASDIIDMVNLAKKPTEYVDKFIQYCNVYEISNEWKECLQEMYNKSPKDGSPLCQALETLIYASQDINNSVYQIWADGFEEITNEFYKFAVKELTKAITDCCPLVKGMKIGQTIGKSISNLLFSTDKTIEEYYVITAYCQVADLFKSVFDDKINQYKNNKTTDNAQKFLTYLDMYFQVYITGNEFGQDFTDVMYTGGIVTYIARSQDEYKNFIEFTKDDTKNAISAHEHITTSWLDYLYNDNLEMYEIYAVALSDFANTYIGVTRVEFEKETVEWGLNDYEHFGYKCTVYPEKAINKDLIYTSSDSSVAEISNKGVLRLNSTGTCVITVQAVDNENVRDTLSVTVIEDGGADSFQQTIFPLTEEVPVSSIKDFTYRVYYGYNEPTIIITGYNGDGTAITIPSEINGKKVTEIGSFAFDKSKLVSVVIPDSVIKIDECAFWCCNDLSAVRLSEKIETISQQVFSGCKNLTYIFIPKSLIRCGKWIFEGSGLENVEFEKGIVHINACLFYNCDSLKVIQIPNTVVRIEGDAFYNCTELTSVIIPSSVKIIERDVFDNCSDKLKIYGIVGSYAETYANNNNIDFVPLNISTLTDKTSSIAVEGVILSNTSLIVTKDEVSSTSNSIVYNIAMSDNNGRLVQPIENVTVKIPVPNGWNGIECKVYRKEANGIYTDMNAKYENNYMVFVTDHFSEYIVTNEILSSNVTSGDVNTDSKVNDQDSILLDRHLAEWGNTIDISAADMNGDGKVNDQDSIILARTLAGWYD